MSPEIDETPPAGLPRDETGQRMLAELERRVAERRLQAPWLDDLVAAALAVGERCGLNGYRDRANAGEGTRRGGTKGAAPKKDAAALTDKRVKDVAIPYRTAHPHTSARALARHVNEKTGVPEGTVRASLKRLDLK